MAISGKATAFRSNLVHVLSRDPRILGIGQTGGVNAPLIPGKSDVDLFVICQSVPTQEERRGWYQSLTDSCDALHMAVCSGGIWGEGDIFDVSGVDVMPMFFTESEMRNYLQETLDGKHLWKEGRFYPVGRLASIEALHVLHDVRGRLQQLIDLVRAHPASFFEKWIQAESGRMIDEEDLGRAELRHEVLFYHQVLEEFLDHFLQLLYAKNNCYFPSQKRCAAYIDSFSIKPERCQERLLRIIRTAASEETIEESVREVRAIAEELKRL